MTLILKVNPAKHRLFQSKQGSFGLQVYIHMSHEKKKPAGFFPLNPGCLMTGSFISWFYEIIPTFHWVVCHPLNTLNNVFLFRYSLQLWDTNLQRHLRPLSAQVPQTHQRHVTLPLQKTPLDYVAIMWYVYFDGSQVPKTPMTLNHDRFVQFPFKHLIF